MNVFEYVMKGKVTKLLPCVIVIVSCFLWIRTAQNEVHSILGFLDFFVYAYYPVAIWFYIQRIHRYYSSIYVHARNHAHDNIFLKEVRTDFVAILIFSVFITIMHFLIMLNADISFIEYPVFFMQICSGYSLLISIFHIVFLIKKEVKVAFIISYSFFLFMFLTDVFFSYARMLEKEVFYIICSICFLSVTAILELFINLYVKRKRDIYEIYL